MKWYAPAMRALGLAIFLTLACLTTAFAQADWREYSYPEEGFAITAPTEPKLVSKTTASGFANRIYEIDFDENHSVQVHVAPSSPQAKLQGSCELIAKRVNGRVLFEKSDTAYGTETEECDLFVGSARIQDRMFVLNRHLYQLITTRPTADHSPTKEMERAVASFRPLPITAEWREYRYPEEHFSISAPFEPRLMKSTTPAGAEVHTYMVGLDRDRALSVTVVPAPDTVGTEELFRRTCQSLAEYIKGNVTEQRSKSLFGTEGWTCLAQSDRLRLRNDEILVKGFFFQITVGAPLSDPGFPAETERLFASFRWID